MASLDIKFCNELYTRHIIYAQDSNGMILMGTNGRVKSQSWNFLLPFFFLGGGMVGMDDQDV